MKKIAITLTILVLLLGGLMVYALVGTQMQVSIGPRHLQALPASEQPQQFARWMDALQNDSVQGTVYDPDAAGSPEDYYFSVYEITVGNSGLLPADMVEVQMAPLKGDVLSYSGQVSMGQDINVPVKVAPGKSATLQHVVLSRQNTNHAREFIITYYIWGNPFTVKKSWSGT